MSVLIITGFTETAYDILGARKYNDKDTITNHLFIPFQEKKKRLTIFFSSYYTPYFKVVLK